MPSKQSRDKFPLYNFVNSLSVFKIKPGVGDQHFPPEAGRVIQ